MPMLENARFLRETPGGLAYAGIVDVLSGVVATVRVGRAKFSSSRRGVSWGNRFGPYPGVGFHLVLRGSCWLISPGVPPTPMRAGDAVFLPHGSVHGMSDRPDVGLEELPPDTCGVDITDPAQTRTHLLCGAYRLDRTLSHPFLRSLPDVVRVPAGSGHHDLRAAIDLLGAELTGPRPGSEAVLPALLDLVLVHLVRAWLDEQGAQHLDRGWPAAMTDPALLAALDRIHDEPSRPWTVQDLADTVRMSRTAFARRFTRVIGQPPLAYLTWWRLNTAARLLLRSDAPLAHVARQVGYTSEFAFAAAFRREFDVAPGRFRRERRPVRDHAAPAHLVAER